MLVQVTSEIQCFQLVKFLDVTCFKEHRPDDRNQDGTGRAALGTKPYEEYLKEIGNV